MLAAVVTRLKDCRELRAVEGIIGLSAVKGVPPATPCAFVFPQAESAAPSATYLATDQTVSQTFGVLLILRSAGDLKGVKAADVIDGWRNAINALLAGWQPPEAETPIEYAGGALVDIVDDSVWWLLRYRNAFRIWS
jgi:hypothetical protein